MSPQEIAVALSHIDVWRLVANGDVRYALILEDDVFFRRGFMKAVDGAWATLMGAGQSPDLLYLSFKEAAARVRKPSGAAPHRPKQGLWQLSGYVLSRTGARRLLALLPARGPIDLWVNLQFHQLDVLRMQDSIIEQRTDVSSSNTYSILPVLAQIGVHARERPVLPKRRRLREPVIAFAPQSGVGASALAMALSMLGYRCCSDLNELPSEELSALWGRGKRQFDAYVNIGSIRRSAVGELHDLYKDARFIFLTDRGDVLKPAASREASASKRDERVGESRSPTDRRVLQLPVDHPDKWELLRTFLECEYPALPYPTTRDCGRRPVGRTPLQTPSLRAKRLQFDRSPWIVPSRRWPGIRLANAGEIDRAWKGTSQWAGGSLGASWVLRDDTFPSNLALFRRDNFVPGKCDAALELRDEPTPVRSLTSAAVATRCWWRYGRFEAVLKPAGTPGVVTGIFLHRNGPRQEIDLEFLGRDTTRLLTNVYFNPGEVGARLEYGYRGTPILIELGFDAAADFHAYAIEWQPGLVKWWVDGQVVHERVVWNPTPIPHLPMQFNVNLWPSRSTELAGRLHRQALPARTWIRSMDIEGSEVEV